VEKRTCKIFLLREITYAPRRPHDGRCKDSVIQDHNTDNPFVPPHTQGSNTTENEAQVWCVHEDGVKRSRQSQRHEVDGKWEKCQTIARGGCNFQE
jgi:hypothetical protein